MGVPESFVFGTPDRYEEKNTDFAIQFICNLRGTVQVIDPELGAGVGYSTDHADHAFHRKEEQRWIGHEPE